MADFARITWLETGPQGQFYVDFEGSTPQMTIEAKWDDVEVVTGPAWTINTPPRVTPFVAGMQYTVTLTVILEDGTRCPSVELLLSAGGADGDWVGFYEGGYGSIEPDMIAVSSDGPIEPEEPVVRPNASVAYVRFSPALEDMPVHPSVTYDPAFDAGADQHRDVYWVYFRDEAGEETLRLVALPAGMWTVSDSEDEALDRDARVWLGPDAAVYYIDSTQTPAGGSLELYDTTVRLMRAATTPYGTPPPTASQVGSYELFASPPGLTGGLFWDEDDKPVLVVGHFGTYVSEADRFAVLTESGLTLNPVGGDASARPSPSVLVGTTQGVFMSGAVLPI